LGVQFTDFIAFQTSCYRTCTSSSWAKLNICRTVLIVSSGLLVENQSKFRNLTWPNFI